MECTHMKPHRIFSLLLAAALLISYGFPAYADDENEMLSEEAPAPGPVSVSANQPEELPAENSGKDSEREQPSVSENQSAEHSEKEPVSVSENWLEEPSGKTSGKEQASVSENQPEIRMPEERPGFSASIEHRFDGYIVKGCFREFFPDTILVQPQSSPDGEIWQDCEWMEWDLSCLGSEDADSLQALQNQICLYDKFEPLKSYLSGKLDRFYVRLHITRENGISYETQAAVIERGEPQPIPEGITYSAGFTPTMLTRETGASGGFVYCGKYQLTVNADASAADIAALLPDTLPIQVDLQSGRKPFADCTIDCPVTWKSLSLPALTAGGSVTLRDTAEEIVIPAGTVLSTPMGRFTLPAPLGIESSRWMTDEVVLVLNVISGDEKPTGVLAINNNELKMAFNLKPTGATAIRAYTLTVGDQKWTELTGLPLLEAVNAQPATANSGYVDILRSDQEPYRSYLAAEFAGEEPKPFLIGLIIEGGVYDGCQLILACPDTYELPPDLVVGGSGGNEGNAGSGNRDDSTEDGQRPNLPKPRSEKAKEEESQTDIPATPTDSAGTPNGSADNTPAIGSRPRTDAAETAADIVKKPQTAAETKRQAGASKVSPDGSAERRTDSDAKPSANLQEVPGSDQGTLPADSAEAPASGGGEPLTDAPALSADTGTAGRTVLFFAAAAVIAAYIAITAVKTISSRKAARP